MTLSPASSHGSTFAGGVITPTTDPALEIDVPETVNQALAIHDTTTSGTTFVVDAFGFLSGTGGDLSATSDTRVLSLDGALLTTKEILRWVAASGIAGRINVNGYPMFRLHSAPADAELVAGECALWVDQTNGAAALGFKGKSANGTVVASKYPLRQSSGALPTVAPVSGTAFQCSTTQDVLLTVPVTYNPGVATTATCKVELSPDNSTFSELVTITQPVGTVFDGSIEAVQLVVPAAWRVKLTVVNATLGTGTYY